MFIIVGLGNPGEKYELTRHNLGFRVVEHLAEKFSPGVPKWKFEKKFDAEICRVDSQILIVKPQTLMNASGYSVLKILRYYRHGVLPLADDMKILKDLWVIHDDLDLPLGKIKIAIGRGSAGHRGIQSIIDALGNRDFVRFRLGIGRPSGFVQAKPEINDEEGKEKKRVKRADKHHEVEKFVLEEFSSKEESEVEAMIKKTVKVIEDAQKSGLEKVKTRYNLG